MPRKPNIDGRLEKIKERLLATIMLFIEKKGIVPNKLRTNDDPGVKRILNLGGKNIKISVRCKLNPALTTDFTTIRYSVLYVIEDEDGVKRVLYSCDSDTGFTFSFKTSQSHKGLLENRTIEELLYLTMALNKEFDL